MVDLTQAPINYESLLQHVQSTYAGAVVLFLGTTREVTGSRRTESLDYEGYPEMARRKLGELETEARRRWAMHHCAIVHRLGHLQPGETSIAIAVSSTHRQEAFEAAKWLIDTIKETVPIWKRENWTDGTSQWVHPGMDAPLAHIDSDAPDKRHE